MAETTLIAKFNTNIETPAPKAEPNSYDLDLVISRYGFDKGSDYRYELTTNRENANIQGNVLTVSDKAYGDVSITVSDSKSGKSTLASTNLYGFYAVRLAVVNNEYFTQKMIGVISDAKTNWPSLLQK